MNSSNGLKVALTAAALVGVMATVTSRAEGQNFASINVTANVNTQPVVVTAVRDLSFGTVTAPTASGPDSSTSTGIFRVQGQNGWPILLSFTKTNLTSSVVGAPDIILNLGTSDLLVYGTGAGEPDATTITRDNPNAPATYAIPADGDRYFGITGSLNIPTRATGNYTGTITLTVNYGP